MKTILLYVHGDDGAEARLQAALDLARAQNGHIACLHVTPLTAYVAGDMFGGMFLMPDLLEAVTEHERKSRAETEARLALEDVSWSFEHADGEPAAAIVANASLADVVVLSRCVRPPRPNEPEPLAGDVAVHARTPVLAVPPEAKGFDVSGTAAIAWNGSVEAANALKAAVPMLRLASAIKVVTVGEEGDTAPRAADACDYLARHGLKPELRPMTRQGRPIGDRLIEAVAEIGAAYLVMGAYGHSRAREFVLGGITRRMLAACPVPLLMAH